MSREDWRTGSIPELPLLRKQKFNKQKGASMAVEKELIALRADEKISRKEKEETIMTEQVEIIEEVEEV